MPFPSRIILPDNGKNLLRRELAAAFAALGLETTRVDPAVFSAPERAGELDGLLGAGPALLLSINFQALERPRPILEALARVGSSAAVWCVDNPWNILAGVRDPSWKGIPLFVTDKSFVGPLQQAGAERVFHLPLAAWPEIFEAAVPEPVDIAPVAFVGRLEFPGRETFFAGINVPEEPSAVAGSMVEDGRRPDFDWWSERLGVEPSGFWPGKKARRPALGAEFCNARLREASLKAGARAGLELTGSTGPGLDIFGDMPHETPLGARSNPPVDYYTRLAGIYRKARYSLCCTSLLLPRGLNQRHFDVWTAGGICLTDNTPGLELFPEELTRPVTYARPQDIPVVVAALERLPETARSGMIRDWQSLLVTEHTYRHRARTILETVNTKGAPTPCA